MHLATELLKNPSLIPEGPGVYFVYFRCETILVETTRRLHPSSDCPAKLGEFELLYLGASGRSMRDRILNHLKRDARVSSLRRTVGVLMKNQLFITADSD
jgi:hypothetical protein